jgi:hypothetical protein
MFIMRGTLATKRDSFSRQTTVAIRALKPMASQNTKKWNRLIIFEIISYRYPDAVNCVPTMGYAPPFACH